MDAEPVINSMSDLMGLVGQRSASISGLDSLMWNNRNTALTLNRSLVSELYQEHGIVQVLIDQPVDDAFRGGIILKIPEFSAEDIQALQHFMNEIDLLQTYAQSLKWMRLFGGAGVIINAGQNPAQPFNIKAIKETTPLEFYATDRWELSYMAGNGYGTDQYYENDLERPYNYYGHVLHKSTVIKLNGKIAPSLIRGYFGGWGVSELEKMVRSFNQYLKHQSVAYEVLDEAKIDVFKIEGFNSAVSTPTGAALTAKRIQYVNQLKNFENAVVLDKEDEYEQKTLSFSGLSEILKEIRIGLACDLRMPLTKLFGISAGGFASGEEETENYNCMIESEIRGKCKHGMIKLLQICCQKLFGYVPQTIDFEWQPLRTKSAADEDMEKNSALQRVQSALQAGLITQEKAVEIINAEKIFDIELEKDGVTDVIPNDEVPTEPEEQEKETEADSN